MEKILIIDNFDSFTYNLVQQIKAIKQCKVVVKRNDEKVNFAQSKIDKLIISPGPKRPENAGISNELIKAAHGHIPVLGVCLGMQCINEVFGGETIHAPLPVHGKTTPLMHSQKGIFQNIPQNMQVARYHSLVISNISDEFEITAKVDKIPMAIQHKKHPTFGVQFHLESFMTEYGDEIMFNFLKL